MSPTKDTKAKGRGGAGRGQGRKKIERPPEIGDKQFAERVLAQIGQARWKILYQAQCDYEAFPGRHARWMDEAFARANYPEVLARWERLDKSERGHKPIEPKDPGPEPRRPPHPKELIGNDEDLALYYLVCHDLSIANRTFITMIEKRDGKAQHNVNHMHDKPTEVNVTFKLADELREARLRVIEMRKTR